MRLLRTGLALIILAASVSAPAFALCPASRLMIQADTGGNFWTQSGRQYGGFFWIAGQGNNLLNAGSNQPEFGVDSGIRGGVPINPTVVTNWLTDTVGDGSGIAVRTWDWSSAGMDGCADINNNGRADPDEVIVVLLVDTTGSEFAIVSVGGNHELGWDLSRITNGVPSVFGVPKGGVPMQPVPRPLLGVPTDAAGGRVNVQVTLPARQRIKTFDDVGGSRNVVQGFHILQNDTLLAEVGGTGSSVNVKANPGQPLVLRTIFGYPGDAGFYVDASVTVPAPGQVPDPLDDPGPSDDAGGPDDPGRSGDAGGPDAQSGIPGASGDTPAGDGSDPAAAGVTGVVGGAAAAAGGTGDDPDAEPVDSDEDELMDDEDNCPEVANPEQEDMDEDGVGDFCDSCPFDPNPDQVDTDDDGLGDVCDPCPQDPDNADSDGDGACDRDDNCPDMANADQEDSDGDGMGDACDDSFNPWLAAVTAKKAQGPPGTAVEMKLIIQNRSTGSRSAKVSLVFRDAAKKETAVPASESCLEKEPWEVEVASGQSAEKNCKAAIPADAGKGRGRFVLKLVDASDKEVTLDSELRVSVR